MAVDQELLFLLKSINTKAVFEQKAPLKMSGYTKTTKTQIEILSIILDKGKCINTHCWRIFTTLEAHDILSLDRENPLIDLATQACEQTSA